MRIQTKLISLLLVLSAVFIASRYLYQRFENRRMYALFKGENEEKNIYFDKLIKLKGANLEILSLDYTYWDEMVDCIRDKDIAWAKSMMDETVLKTYNADGIWVYNTDFSLVYSVKTPDAAGLEKPPFPEEAITDMFLKERLRHFFINTDAGLMEIRAATVHSTDDPERKTPPQGYFFTGRLWKKEYIHELADLIEGSIKIDTVEEKIPSLEVLSASNSVVFSRQLAGWSGKPAAYIYATIQSKELQSYKLFSRNAAVIFVVFLISVIIFIALSLTAVINLPLGIISSALRKDDPEGLRKLEKDTSEFGDIARLISRFFKQRKELLWEVSERKKAETRFQQVADAAEEWIWEVDKDGLYVYSNRLVEKILGYKPEEIIAKKYFYDFFTPENRQDLKRIALEAFAARKPFKNFLNPNLHKNGNTVFLETSGSPVLDKEGNLLGYSGTDIDVTERKKAEEELQRAYTRLQQTQDQLIQAEKLSAVGQLASGVAHEVRNPLAIILQGVNYLGSSLSTKGGYISETLNTLKDNIKRADKIIDALFNFSRSASLDLQPEDLNLILESSLGLVRSRSQFTNINIIMETSKDLHSVLADKNKLEQVFINILLNAVQAMPGGGQIIIRTFEKELREIKNGIGKRAQDIFRLGEKAVIVEIEDTGKGISEENLKRVFDPFFTTKGPTGGAGLGLSVTKSIIQMHKGLIYAESELDKGTKITIILKRAQRG